MSRPSNLTEGVVAVAQAETPNEAPVKRESPASPANTNNDGEKGREYTGSRRDGQEARLVPRFGQPRWGQPDVGTSPTCRELLAFC